MTPLGIEPVTCRFVAQCIQQLPHRVSQRYNAMFVKIRNSWRSFQRQLDDEDRRYTEPISIEHTQISRPAEQIPATAAHSISDVRSRHQYVNYMRTAHSFWTFCDTRVGQDGLLSAFPEL